MIIIRKLRSALIRATRWFASQWRMAYCRLIGTSVRFGRDVSIGRMTTIRTTDGGRIKIGNQVSIGANVLIDARQGDISIGDNVLIGDGCIIVSLTRIEIGALTQIAEYVVIRDQDHMYSQRPIKTAGFLTAPVSIGEDCWLGCKSTILRGSMIGNGAVIGAHSLVRGIVPPFTLAAGCPAKYIKELPAA